MIKILPFLIAVIGGLCIACQAALLGAIDRRLGTLESVFFTYVLGGLVIPMIMLALRGGNLAAWRMVPWWAFGAGLLGLVIVGAIGFAASRLGVVAAFTIIVSSQFIFGAIIDHLGLFSPVPRPLDMSRLVGIAVLLTGIWLVLRK